MSAGVSTLLRQGLEHYRIPSTGAAVDKLALYVLELEKWNKRINLTGLRGAEEMVTRLLYDAFFLYALVAPCRKVIDLGSGAGVVAIPLALLCPGSTFYSIDKSLRKIQFQRHAKRILALSNLALMHGRAETFDPVGADALIAKAFGAVPTILHIAALHLTKGGVAFLVRGPSEQGAEVQGFVEKERRFYRLPEAAADYQLFVYKKVS